MTTVQGPSVVVVGGGIAGVSAGYFLATSGRAGQVTLIEAEQQLAHHTTGRSAAVLIENYGAAAVRPLTTASLDFLHAPPTGLADFGLLDKRGMLSVATTVEDYGDFDAQLEAGSGGQHPVVEIDRGHAERLAPHLRTGPEHRYMWEEHAHDIDVAGLHQTFVRGMRAAGADIRTATRLDTARWTNGQWNVETTQGAVVADVVVNAAGAWGDVVAEAAGIAPVGLTPMRRTAFMVKSPFEGSEVYAFVADIMHRWYLRPDGAQFLCSPADETPSEPCDARAQEIDVARTIDMLNEHTKLTIRTVTSQWAGLRTFSPDRALVIGPEPVTPSFVWCVGQGGIGIQTSPGAGRLVADLLLDGAPGPAFDDTGLRYELLSPARFRR